MTNELLPCPFCGHDPEMFQIGQNRVKIKCTNCLVEKEQKVLRQSTDWLKEQMAIWWNNRFLIPEEPIKKEIPPFIYDDEDPNYIRNNEDGL